MKASSYVISITTFDSDGALDEPALRSHFQRFARAGIGVYVAGSSPGEGYSLTLAETERVFQIAHDELKGRVPVRAMGIEPRSQAELIELCRLAEAAELDAVQVYPLDVGHGNRPSDAELERYFRDVIEATGLAAVLSTHFTRGFLVPIDMIERLIDDYPQLTGINCSTNDMVYLCELIERVDQRAEIHVGGPLHAMTALAQGAQGYLCADANVAPVLCQSVIDLYVAGDFPAAFAAYTQVMRLYSGNPWPWASVRWVKAAMELLGYDGYHLRPPHDRLEAHQLAAVERTLARLRIPELTSGEAT